MIRNLAALLLLFLLTNTITTAQSPNDKVWVKDKVAIASKQASDELKKLSRRLDFGNSIESTVASMKLNDDVTYEENTGTSNEPLWRPGTIAGGKILFHDKDAKKFTAIFAWREEFVSRCRFPGKAFEVTFVQVIIGQWKKRSGYEITHITVPLQGAREFGDLRFVDVERFNNLVVYDRYRTSVESNPDLKFVAETIRKYEHHKGADAWKEHSVGGEAQMTKCDPPNFPLASKDTNQ